MKGEERGWGKERLPALKQHAEEAAVSLDLKRVYLSEGSRDGLRICGTVGRIFIGFSSFYWDTGASICVCRKKRRL